MFLTACACLFFMLCSCSSRHLAVAAAGCLLLHPGLQNQKADSHYCHATDNPGYCHMVLPVFFGCRQQFVE